VRPMGTDALDVMVLRAMLRLARKRQDADDGAIALRVGASTPAVRAALRRLDSRGLVERRRMDSSPPSRLTMQGFALAVALPPRPKAARRAGRKTSRAA